MIPESKHCSQIRLRGPSTLSHCEANKKKRSNFLHIIKTFVGCLIRPVVEIILLWALVRYERLFILLCGSWVSSQLSVVNIKSLLLGFAFISGIFQFFKRAIEGKSKKTGTNFSLPQKICLIRINVNECVVLSEILSVFFSVKKKDWELKSEDLCCLPRWVIAIFNCFNV